MRALEFHAQALRVVDELGADDGLGRIALLHPVNDGHEDVLLGVVG